MASHIHKKRWDSDDWRADLVASVGEFLGTFTFLLFGLGGIQAARTASVISGTSGTSQQVTVPSVEVSLNNDITGVRSDCRHGSNSKRNGSCRIVSFC